MTDPVPSRRNPFGRLALALSACLPGLGPAASAQGVTALWVNDGGDKVAQEELRASQNPAGVVNRVWDGATISLFGARNEVVSFNLVIEAAGVGVSGMAVTLGALGNGAGRLIKSEAASGDGVFDWTQRPVELFYVRYLPIRGLSLLAYGTYDERHIPKRLRRPWLGEGVATGTWRDRPDHDRNYPEIAVPLELVPSFEVAAGKNQSVWVDIYIATGTPAGLYQGILSVRQAGTLVKDIPVRLSVYDFTLPDAPSAKTMVYYSASNIHRRFLGSSWVDPATAEGARARLVRDRYYQVAHRHRISLIGDEPANDCGSMEDRPCPESAARLSGSLFTAAKGYAGPGTGVGNGVYSIGTYGNWAWKSGGETAMRQHADAWASWFAQNSPSTEYFLYLADESSDYPQTETWARWILNNPGPGRALRSFATLPLTVAAAQTPSLDIPASTLGVGVAAQWQPLADRYTTDARKRFFLYNGSRPSGGSFATDDDGVALRELAWAQYKKRINRWFFWESTYYNNFQGNTGDTSLFRNAHTFGNATGVDAVLGETGWNHSNGDGVLLYPGTDRIYPADSYGVDGPFASLRLKHWRRGLQDVEYLVLAAAKNPAAVESLVKEMVPKAAWEYGVSDPNDPTWIRTDISWSIDPDAWESARRRLAEIIAAAPTPAAPKTPSPPRRLKAVPKPGAP